MDPKLLSHAKSYIDALACGVNPLTGEAVPEGDVINQVRISRCLFYVSDVLGEVLKKANAKAAPELAPFSPEQLDLTPFVFVPEGLTVTNFVAAINACRPETMKKLQMADVTRWLVAHDYLREEIRGNKKRKRVTPQGQQIGITEQERTGNFGTYYQILYLESAQRFLIDQLSAIAAAE